MANPAHVAVLDYGVEVWNAWRDEHRNDRIDLSGAILDERDLSRANFRDADLSYVSARKCVIELANFVSADLTGADLSDSEIFGSFFDEATLRQSILSGTSAVGIVSFRRADLREADLSRANLTARFVDADLSRAVLEGSNLSESNFAEAILVGANLRNANLAKCNLQGVDLSGAILEGTNLASAAIYRQTPANLDLSLAANVPSSVPPKEYVFLAPIGGNGAAGLTDPPADKRTANLLEVFFVTDRARLAPFGPRSYYSGRDVETLEFGVCQVSVPWDRRIGSTTALQWWKFEFRENLSSHIVLLNVEANQPGDWFRRLEDSAARADESCAFVFVHGFNVKFEDAARKAAQLASDLKFVGVPIVYSWASKASVKHYLADTTTTDRTIRRLAAFLDALVTEGKFKTVHLLAHSLGCRAVTHALEALAAHRKDRPLRQVVFAAPDVDVTVFTQRREQIVRLGERITVYCSSCDTPLAISRHLHQADRLGERPVIVDQVDTVDASGLDMPDIFGHSLTSERTVLADIFELFRKGTPPNARFGVREHPSGAGYYELCP